MRNRVVKMLVNKVRLILDVDLDSKLACYAFELIHHIAVCKE
jgi:hypothetical protein